MVRYEALNVTYRRRGIVMHVIDPPRGPYPVSLKLHVEDCRP